MAYYDGLASQYMAVFVSYMVLCVGMCLIFGLVIFKKLKEQIMTSANILAILPMEDLDHKEKRKIDLFLSN